MDNYTMYNTTMDAISTLMLLPVGFLSWWGTGIDDVLLLGLLMKQLRQTSQQTLVFGNAFGVLLILSIANLIVHGALRLAPSLFEMTLFSIPLPRTLGIVPLLIGVHSLYRLLIAPDTQNVEVFPNSSRLSQWTKSFFLGLYIYLFNSMDDLSLHVSILSNAGRQTSEGQIMLPFLFYAGGVLVGEATSILFARWLSAKMAARRALEFLSAWVVIGIGFMVLLGGFR